MPKKILLTAVVTATLSSALWAGGERELQIENRALVLEEPDGLFIEAPLSRDFQTMIVRIVDADRNLVREIRSSGESVALMGADLPDGEYHYEIISIMLNANPDMSLGAEVDQAEFSTRERGQFQIDGGAITSPQYPSQSLDDQASLSPNAESAGLRLISAAIDFFVPSAHAQNHVPSSTTPAVTFDDTQDEDCSPGWDWAIFAEGGTSDSDFSNSFTITGTGENGGPCFGNVPIVVIDHDGDDDAASSVRSIDVSSNGDIRLADGAFILDKSTGELSLGSGVDENQSLALSSLDPEVFLIDESAADTFAEFENDAGFARFKGRDGTTDSLKTIMQYDLAAPDLSFAINEAGNVIVGDASIVAPNAELTVAGGNPYVWLKNTSGADGGLMGFQADALRFWATDGGANKVVFHENAPTNSLVLDANGQMDVFGTDLVVDSASTNVGVGTDTPTQPLHVQRLDTAQVFVENTTATGGARTLFKLSNAGNTKFEIENTEIGNSWAFTNSGADFRVSLQGSGVVEFRVDNSGDAFLDGSLTQNSDVNRKQNIVPISNDEVLQKVVALPVSQWEYKDAPGVSHIGPMAQDFHAAFGLGADETGISTIDTGGVALAAIQALAERNEGLEQQNEQLTAQNLSLEQRVHELEQQVDRVEALEAAVMMLSEQVLRPVQVASKTH